MSRAGKWRVRRGTVAGLATAALLLVLARTFILGNPTPDSRFVVALSVMLVLASAAVSQIAIFLAGRTRSVSVLDSVAGMMLLLMILFFSVVYSQTFGDPVEAIEGEPCMGGDRRKSVTSFHRNEEGNWRISYDCLTPEEYATRNPEFAVGEVTIQMSIGPKRTEDKLDPVKVLNWLAERRFMLTTLVVGVIAGTLGWLAAFGRRWRVRTDML